MANKELNKALYERMEAENQQFQKWLMSQSKEEILNHAYEYITKNDILMAVEGNNLSDEQVQALLQSPSPLEDVYKEFKEIEFDHMDDIRSVMQNIAEDWIQEDKEEVSKITVIKVEPAKAPYVKEIDDGIIVLPLPTEDFPMNQEFAEPGITEQGM